jgi:hypothetical protein
MAFCNQSRNNNFHNGGGESAASIVSVYERVFGAEQGSKYGNGETSAAKRCAVRVTTFENPHGLRVGYSKQWFAGDLSRWSPSRKGHILFSFKAWRNLVAPINTNDEQLKCGFGGDGYDDGQVGNDGGRMGCDTQRLSGSGQSTKSNASANTNMSGAATNNTDTGATCGLVGSEEVNEKAKARDRRAPVSTLRTLRWRMRQCRTAYRRSQQLQTACRQARLHRGQQPPTHADPLKSADTGCL